MNKEKKVRQLFAGKVADIIGEEKVFELLKESKNEIDFDSENSNHVSIDLDILELEIFRNHVLNELFLLSDKNLNEREMIKARVLAKLKEKLEASENKLLERSADHIKRKSEHD